MSASASSRTAAGSGSGSSKNPGGTFLFVDAADGNALPQYLKQLREKYDDLPDQGKFVTGAVIGYGSSKFVTKSAVTVVKFAGAAFVA